MTAVVKIDGEAIDLAEFVRILKLTGKFDPLLDQIVRDRLVARAARNAGIQASDAEIQQFATEFRRARGLHRAADTDRFLNSQQISVEEFETFITDAVYQEKMLQQVSSKEAVQEYFRLNSPRFDALELSHIVLDAEPKAREIMAILADDPESFAEMAREHSIALTRSRGGVIGTVLRGSLRPDVEAKAFAASDGDLVGPFTSTDRKTMEIIRVDARRPAQLDDATVDEVRRILREQWLLARMAEHSIETP
jgi:parvulin-like peptidyl-prolyl isomerase